VRAAALALLLVACGEGRVDGSVYRVPIGAAPYHVNLDAAEVLREDIEAVTAEYNAQAPCPLFVLDHPGVPKLRLDANNETYWDRSALGMTLGEPGTEVTILIREVLKDWSEIRPLLVHELGHALGAGHVDDKASVMYPHAVSGISVAAGVAQVLDIIDVKCGQRTIKEDR